MPSYDKEKLMRMMQERRVGFLTSRDLSERLRDLRAQASRMALNMRVSGQSAGSPDFIEMLLAMPLEEAMARSKEQVENYRYLVKTRSGDVEKVSSSGVHYATWCEFNQMRMRVERIEIEQNRHDGLMTERFAILQKLKDAVVDWGFNNPDHEM